MSKQIEFDHLAAMLQGVVLPEGPKIDRLIISSPSAQIKVKPFTLDLKEAADVTAEVGEANLAAYLGKILPGNMSGVKVECADGKVTVRAKAKFIVDIPVEAVCTLRLVEGRQLFVDLQSVNVLGGGAATGMVEDQIRKANPILSSSDLPFDLEMESVVVANGQVEIKGKALLSGDL